MAVQKQNPEPEDKPRIRLSKSERKKLLAEMKDDFDNASRDQSKWEKEQKDRQFWDQLA